MNFLRCLLILVVSFISITLSGSDGAAESSTFPTGTVSIDGTVLFVVNRPVGSFTIQERADAIKRHILQIRSKSDFTPRLLSITDSDSGSAIRYADSIIMLITDDDAAAVNTTRNELAGQTSSIIKNYLIKESGKSKLKTWIFSSIKLIITLIITALLIAGSIRLFNYIVKTISSRTFKRIKPLKIRTVTLLSPAQQIRYIQKTVSVLRIATFVIIGYAGLTVIFGIFPITRTWSATLLNLVITPLKSAGLGLISYLPNLFAIIVIIAITRYLLRLIHFLFTEIEKGHLTFKRFYKDWAMPTYSICRFIIYAFMIVLIFPYLPGSDSAAFKGVSVFLGVLFSLGSSSVISNAVSGLVITYMRPFAIGDRVKIGEITGDVIEKAILVTRIRTIKNEIITLPNSSILSGHTVNYSSAADSGVIIHSTVTIGYDVPWKQIYELLTEAALRTPLIKKNPKPFVLQTSLDDFYISYQINAYTSNPQQMAVIYSSLHENIQDCFAENGVEIMSPHYNSLRDGSQPAIPKTPKKKARAVKPIKKGKRNKK